MQINLRHHPKAFISLELAFNPLENARYAAQLFKRLRTANLSLSRVIAHYHSTRPARNGPYSHKVIRLRNKEPLRHFAEQREIRRSGLATECRQSR